MNYNIRSTLFLVLFCVLSTFAQNSTIDIAGSVTDNTEIGVPYVAVSILARNIGTVTNEEGKFQFEIKESYLSDTLEVSSIGFETYKVVLSDYIASENKTIKLEDAISTLDEVSILLRDTRYYVKNAIKNLKENTISKPHQLNLLYRRFSIEDNSTRFFVEHYMKVVDRGPISLEFEKFQILEGRKSADYRFIKQKQHVHSIKIMNKNNPLRQRTLLRKYEWKKIGDTFYDGEDVIILVGSRWKGDSLKLYIGMDTYNVYKMENSDLDAVFIYKKNSAGKLYLSYHNREWKSKKELSGEVKKYLKKKGNKIELSYRHEMIVLGIETDKKKIKVKDSGQMDADIGDLEVIYHPEFWKNFSSPPPTAFHKKSVEELEAVYGVPIQVQFDAVNN